MMKLSAGSAMNPFVRNLIVSKNTLLITIKSGSEKKVDASLDHACKRLVQRRLQSIIFYISRRDYFTYILFIIGTKLALLR